MIKGKYLHALLEYEMNFHLTGSCSSFWPPDLSYSSPLSTACPSNPDDRSTPLDFEDPLPTTEVPSGNSLPYHHSTCVALQNLPVSVTSVHMMPAANTSSTGHMLDVEHGFEREAMLLLRPPFSETCTTGYYSDPFDSFAFPEEAVVGVQPDLALESQSSPEVVYEWPCSVAQDPCTYFASAELPTNLATSETATAIDPTLQHGQSNLRPRETSVTCEPPFSPFWMPASAGDHSVEDGISRNFRISPTSKGWQCPHPSCASKTIFTRQCDFNKHYRLHLPRFACRVPSCHHGDAKPRMFASRKDRNRHEAAHSRSLSCNLCTGIFSRRDNLRDHCRKVHGHLI